MSEKTESVTEQHCFDRSPLDHRLAMPKPEKTGPKPPKRLKRGGPIARTSRPRKQRKTTLAGLHRKLWALFARYVKDRDGNQCFTCPSQPEGPALQAGHMIRSTKQSVRYHPDNVHSQCVACNKWKNGNEGVYSRRFIARYGLLKFEMLHAKAEKTHAFKAYQLEELIAALETSPADYELLYESKYGVGA